MLWIIRSEYHNSFMTKTTNRAWGNCRIAFIILVHSLLATAVMIFSGFLCHLFLMNVVTTVLSENLNSIFLQEQMGFQKKRVRETK